MQIFAKQAGTTSITLKDAEGTVVVVNVTVTGGSTGGSQTDEEIILTPEQKEYVTRFEADIETLFQEFDFDDIVQINSEATESGKKKAIVDGKLTTTVTSRIQSYVKNFITRVNALDDINTKVSIIKRLESVLNKKLSSFNKPSDTQKKALVNYFIYSFQEYRERFEAQSYRLSTNTNNPFDTAYFAEFRVELQMIEASISIELELNYGYTPEKFKETYGGFFTKKGLDFLVKHKIISQEEYNKYVAYTPQVSTLLEALGNEEGTDALLKAYFPNKKGADDGFEQAVIDNLQDTLDSLDPRDIPEVLLGLRNLFGDILSGKYNVESVKEAAGEIYEIYVNIEDIIAELDDYKKAYYKSYIKTNIAFVALPTGRLKAIKWTKKLNGKKDTPKMEEIKNLSKLKKLKDITNGLVGKYKNLECKEFAKDLASRLSKEGIEFIRIPLEAKRSIFSQKNGMKTFGKEIISENGYHEVIRIGDKIYDNVNPKGITLHEFKEDIGIYNDPLMFTKGLDLLK